MEQVTGEIFIRITLHFTKNGLRGNWVVLASGTLTPNYSEQKSYFYHILFNALYFAYHMRFLVFHVVLFLLSSFFAQQSHQLWIWNWSASQSYLNLNTFNTIIWASCLFVFFCCSTHRVCFFVSRKLSLSHIPRLQCVHISIPSNRIHISDSFVIFEFYSWATFGKWMKWIWRILSNKVC